MFLQLGNIVFDKANSPNSISEKLDIAFAQHDLINQRPRLQPTGRELEEHTYSLYLHRDFSRVQAEIDQLKASAIAYEVLPMLWGNGTVAGNFVITSLTIGKPYMSGEGDVYAADVEMTLKEFPVNPVTDRQAKADKKAYATGTNKAVTGRRAGATGNQAPQEKPCNKYIAEAVSKLKAQVHQVRLQHEYFQNNVGDFTASGVIGPSISRPALQARNTATVLAKEHFNCVRLNANEVLQVQRTAQALADAASRPPAISSTWWVVEEGKYSAFVNAVNAFVLSAESAVNKAVSRSED